MKNIHIFPTSNPSRLFEILKFNFVFDNQNKYSEEYKKIHKYKNQNIYITSDEKPKQGEWSLYQNKIHKCIEDILGDEFKKIILTTDQDLIKDGVQSIDDDFLEWFVNNSSCEYVELVNYNPFSDNIFSTIIPKEDWLLNNPQCKQIESCSKSLSKKCICPKEEPKQEHNKYLSCCRSKEECHCGKNRKQETLGDFIKRESKSGNESVGMVKGAKWQQEQDKNKYSEEEAKTIWRAGQEYWKTSGESITFEELIEQFKKK
jgi:hypothetical protein